MNVANSPNSALTVDYSQPTPTYTLSGITVPTANNPVNQTCGGVTVGLPNLSWLQIPNGSVSADGNTIESSSSTDVSLVPSQSWKFTAGY